jgi:hypothetical protein
MMQACVFVSCQSICAGMQLNMHSKCILCVCHVSCELLACECIHCWEQHSRRV